jgi:hypothetical protein
MKTMVITMVLIAVSVCGAWAKLGDLVASFDNIGSSTHYGLAADANYVYTFYYYSSWNYPIIRMLRTNGSFVSSYPCPFGTTSPEYYCRGLSYGGSIILYLNNYYQRAVGRLYAHTGSMISTWTWPSGYRYGVCCTHNGSSAGTRIYQSYYTGDFWFSTTTGSLISSFKVGTTTYNFDLAWDYGNDMIWYGNYSTHHVYGITTGGSIVSSWRVPSAVSYPYGIAYYGEYLYVSTSSGSPDEYIWIYHCPNTVSLTPASVGKIKALLK